MRWQQVATGAAVVTLAVAVGGVAVAASDNGTPSAALANLSTEDGLTLEPGMGHRHRFGPPGHGAGPFGALHGEYTVENGEDSYQTIATQRGTVQSVSDTSLRVRSEDDYTRTYVVRADTLVNAERDGIDSIEDGDEISVMATVDGDTATAVSIDDATSFREHPFFEQRRVRG